MLRVVTADEMRRIDRYAIEKIGIPSMVLMENAGRSLFAQIVSQSGPIQGKRVGVFCGVGNNGGDGFVVARYLKLAEAEVTTILVGGEEPHTDDARRNFEILKALGVDIKIWPDGAPSRLDLIVDAIFGTGLVRNVEEPYRSAVRTINRMKVPVTSADIPSGLNSDSGEAMGEVVSATTTVTFGFKKKGFYLNDGPKFCGEVRVADISLADCWADQTDAGKLYEVQGEDFREWFPKRKKSSHKGSYGHLLVIAGSPRKSGAAVLASKAALRSGAGLVTLATPKSAHTIVKKQLIEVMTEPLPDDGEGNVSAAAVEVLIRAAKKKNAVVIGPGIEPTVEFRFAIERFVEATSLPVVLDADGLNLFESRLTHLGGALRRFILTPHPGEMARLVEMKIEDVEKNRIDVAKNFSKKSGATVVLKGANTVTALFDGRVFINPTGNLQMATAGTGDVLSGMIGAYLAQGLSPERAAIAAVFRHGLAGDRLASRMRSKGMLASDLVEELPYL